ncbi:type I phosphomannose isomerase catalytic subunit [Sedimentisphaera salicampi]|uniref:type I phosphomannose isomerase catalytic subunit n=1 Tax=Sedimentisphaera salicampi TaxID=1941349 RepID=UPI000B9C9F73|nr:type I phosphomannose isomerase catalytic subunit [Sedimentisphaera salicampi]OXU15889.1 putative mannose-6-phosphate isomerase GmuF [Sedimentisphaera salicampi]
MIYPIKFEPILVEKVWGGNSICRKFLNNPSDNRKIGESWLLSDIPGARSRIVNGELKGLSINEIVEKYPSELFGGKFALGSFPLMIKIIDAGDRLSLQVHPDQKTCEETGKGNPKTECWYILDAEPDSFIYKGLKEGVTPDQLRQGIETSDCERLLQKVHVKPGECHFIPSGTFHAIGSGILIAEIQQPSDTTYRVYDWGRMGQDGSPRQLHIKEALDCIKNMPDPANEPTTEGRLVDADEFNVDKKSLAAGEGLKWDKGDLAAVFAAEGEGSIKGNFQGEVKYGPGECIILPYCFEGEIKAAEKTDMLISRV